MTLTLCHMCFSGTAMRIGAKLGLFVPKQVPASSIALFALSGVGSVAFCNLTLQFNSVGFYQLSKLSCVPATVLVQMFYYKQKFRRSVLLSLLVLLGGVGGATVTDMELNPFGFVMGLLSIAFTTWYQIWIGVIQKDLNLTQFQLLHAVTPYWAGMQLFVALFVDVLFAEEGQKLFQYDGLSTECLLMFLVSCSLAVGVNFSGFLLIHVTSAITYMVVGNVKTLLIISSAFILFNSPVLANNLACICLALCGVVMYGYFKSKPAQQEEKQEEMVEARPLTADDTEESDV
eukprot:CAMPEP_0175847972 /NCGR_PEP_ID=MMETSP0107_2-20121207/23654_1 /TAXON_ID=195067 ORGANISM="Goniomonas pacifica, Strain CCMP1869" /NCGR_SAMPLE_ID=MMETSP0107_2 /ASSEMBLY_ACC=CAM_ASM_000203 /LENGTH=288 /DNA_ID=CAMNT_0017162855 /DNA_START=46 /DNA_END=912 /DNA_ORIENTATION=-